MASNEDAFVEILRTLSEDLTDNDVIDRLGSKLRIPQGKITRAIDTNYKSARITHEGTLNMLRDWYAGCKDVKDAREKLRKALIAVERQRFAEKHLASARTVPTQQCETEIEPDADGLYTSRTVQAAISGPNPSQRETAYPTWRRLPKGYAYILNNKDYPLLKGNSKFRKGSETDFTNAKHLFKELGYELREHENLERDDIVSTITETLALVNTDGSRHGSVCLVLMGHGDKDGFLGVDSKSDNKRIVTVQEIKQLLFKDGNNTLIGKPKLLFFNACRGEEYTPGTTDHDAVMLEMDGLGSTAIDSGVDVPVNADIFVAYSTSNGYYSMRNTVQGSWFIQALCEVFLAYAYVDDLNELMRKVTYKVTDCFSVQVPKVPFKARQTPTYESQGMRKKFFFFPKYQEGST